MPNRINCPPPRHFCPFPQCGKPFTRKDQIIDLLDAATQKHDVISHFIIAAWNYLLDNALRVWNPEIKSAILRRRRTSRARSTPAFWMAHSVWGLILVVLIPSNSLCRSPKGSVQVCIGLHRSTRSMRRSARRSVQVCIGPQEVCAGLQRGWSRPARVCTSLQRSRPQFWIFGFGGHRLRSSTDPLVDLCGTTRQPMST